MRAHELAPPNRGVGGYRHDTRKGMTMADRCSHCGERFHAGLTPAHRLGTAHLCSVHCLLGWVARLDAGGERRHGDRRATPRGSVDRRKVAA